MKPLTIAVATAMFATLLTAGLALAASTPVPTSDAHVNGPGGSASHTPVPEGDVHIATPLPPPPVGKCKTDAALKERCAAMWERCVAAKHGAASVCKYDWRACCTDKPLEHF
jgi:hypothetical protein